MSAHVGDCCRPHAEDMSHHTQRTTHAQNNTVRSQEDPTWLGGRRRQRCSEVAQHDAGQSAARAAPAAVCAQRLAEARWCCGAVLRARCCGALPVADMSARDPPERRACPGAPPPLRVMAAKVVALCPGRQICGATAHQPRGPPLHCRTLPRSACCSSRRHLRRARGQTPSTRARAAPAAWTR